MENLEKESRARETENKTVQEKKARLILRYINKKIIEGNKLADKERETKIKEHYKGKSPREKADELHRKVIVYMLHEQKRKEMIEKETKEEENKHKTPDEINPSLISRIKILANDPEVQRLLPDTYGQARVDQKMFGASEIAKDWHSLEESVAKNTKALAKIKQDLFQENIQGDDDIDEARSEIVELGDDIEEDKGAQDGITELVGYERTSLNTDNVAMLHYEKLKKYREQLDNGFVWLPSREEINEKAMRVIESGNPKQTRKGVFFISEPGSGKTEQIRAISEYLTGMERVKISCGPKTGESQLLGQGKVFPGATKVEEGTFTDFTRSASGAWTGYDYSYDDKPTRDHSQVVELDEMPRAFENETFFVALKGFFAIKDGDIMPGTNKKVLPGRVMIGSGNMGQHHGPKTFPPALEREFIVIPVDYPEMDKSNPELYEFMLTTLMEEGVIRAPKKELSPAYQKREIPEDERKILSDGSIVVAKKEIIDDPTNKEHGFLYRLAYAIKAVQNSYMARGEENSYIDYRDRELLRSKRGNNDTKFVSDTGKEIILGTTITLNDIIGWAVGYNKETKKKSAQTLSEYLQSKLLEKIEEKYEDSEELRAIFSHFHLLDEVSVDYNAKPITPKEIGYLSPRVPRPVYVEKSQIQEQGVEGLGTEIINKKVEEYETKEVILEDGVRVLVRVQELTLEDGSFDLETESLVTLTVDKGRKIRIGNKDFVFTGIIEDKNSEHNGSPIVKSSNEDLYSIFSKKEIDSGIFSHDSSKVIEDIEIAILNLTEKFWEHKCVQNKENNPDKIVSPV